MAKKTMPQKALDPNQPIFQLKITLEDIEPAIWRRIETHDCSLTDLHEVIQSCMGWEDEHMHAFEIGDAQYTDVSRGVDPEEFRDSRSVQLSDLVAREQCYFIYEYDFGDSWRHGIEIENALPAEKNVRYPRCVDGQRACPPEDCGGSCGYYELLDAIANPDEEEYDERLEWLDDDFDPEKFSIDEVNKELLRLRRWIGQHPRLHGSSAQFAVGDRIRAKSGVVHSQYPDIPLGGWVGTVTKIAWLVPISYEVCWTSETLAAVHPVYAKRCRRDDTDPESHWLDEEELEMDLTEQPVPMEQPTALVIKALSGDDQDDRIRMVFGLTSDDPLPAMTDEAQQQYLDYLKVHLAFPFDAVYWSELTEYSSANIHAEVIGFASSSIDPVRGLLCEVRHEQGTEQVPLSNLELDEDDVNCRYVDDYTYWLEDLQGFGDDGEDDDEEYWGDEEEEDEDDDYDEGDIGPRFAGDFGGESPLPQPFRKERPSVGRNDPCPCGSGKKFKKCCLKKQGNEVVE